MGLGTTGWGFSKTDGVPVELVESQWGCLESQWGRLSMGMLQGVEDDIKIAPSEKEEKSLLFVVQTQEQQQLLNRYGNDLCLLDTTFKTIKYGIPLFFLCMKTNVKYEVVAAFVIQYETTNGIAEALSVIKDWNPNWSPSYFMTDYSEEEIGAIEQVFRDSFMYICDFHLEQAWQRWIKQAKHGIEGRKSVLAMLCCLPQADTVEKFHTCPSDLQSSSIWNSNAGFRSWFTKTWLKVKECWVWAFRRGTYNFNVSTTNSLERQNECLKYDYLKDMKKCCLTDMIDVLLTEFFPDSMREYITLNIKCWEGSRKYSDHLPAAFLINRPKDFVNHVRQRYINAEAIHPEDITEEEPGFFKVKKQSHEEEDSKEFYCVRFGGENERPSCECRDWQ